MSGINKYYGKNHVIKNLDLTIEEGEFMTLLGPSGCGKTTTLRIISGLERPQSGVVRIGGKDVVSVPEMLFVPPTQRELSLVFQGFALWPHMTVYENVAFGLETKKMPKKQIESKVDNTLSRLQILEYKSRYPSELSGGQQQRVAIARSIVSEPGILLFDEPLSNLDAKLRIEMRSEIKRLHKELQTTVVYVTHDQTEALTMSTRIAVFFDGRLTQVDTPVNLYRNPCDLRVADFIGNPGINLVEASARSNGATLTVSSGFGEMAFSEDTFVGGTVPAGEFLCVIAIRPEQVKISRSMTGIAENTHEGVICQAMYAGSETLIQVSACSAVLWAKELGLSVYRTDDRVRISIDTDMVSIYDRRTGNLIKKATA